MVPLNSGIRGLCTLILGFVLGSTTTTTITFVHSKTDASDVSALNNMYTGLNSASQLSGWKSSGGDPCGNSWKGITCSGSSVTEINLSGLGLNGKMGYQLSNLKSVTKFDLSKNNLKDDIPYQLPPNAKYIDLSTNSFNGGVPYSISQMKDLKYLNLGHNELNGQLSDMFGQLPKLAKMDLSFNSLTGNLPQSFKSLSSLNILNLQNNQFTGPVDVLADLPLDNLNIENNKFTGWVPDELKSIESIKTGGNSWSSGPAPPPPPGTKSKPRRDNHSKGDASESGLSGGAIVGIVVGVLVVLGFIVAALLARRRRPLPPSHFLEEDRLSQRRPFTPLASQELSNDLQPDIRNSFRGNSIKKSSFKIGSFKINSVRSNPSRELKSSDSSSALPVKALQTSPSLGLKPPPSDHLRSFNDDEFAHVNIKKSTSFQATCYALSELQTATANFATGRLLGEGSIGRVYRAKYADGKVLAVKKIDSSHFQGERGVDFAGLVANITKLRHPNIAEVIGYCSEQGQHMLVYEYFRNGSLHDFLHLSDDFSRPLTWNTRVRIALGTARAVEYLHEVCSPSSVHKNIKSRNVLLDTELNPHLSDCGLEEFHERTSQNLGTGYNAPECTKPSAYTMKSDIYSFGVVMLELLTGRMPFNSSKPRLEQSLVRWAGPQLHDIDALTKMVDPGLCGLYPPKSLSRFADIIALCIQSEPDFRPPISELVQSLVRLVQRSSMSPSASNRMDDFDY